MKQCDSKLAFAYSVVDQAIVVTLSRQLTWSRFIELPTRLFGFQVTAEGAR